MLFKSFESLPYEEVEELIPAEYRKMLAKRELYGGAANFVFENVGAIAWKPDGDMGEILSLYVLPEARRLGVGAFLLQSAVRDMQKKGCKGVSFKYNENDERALLTSFFNDNGFETDVTSFPLGKKSLSEVKEAANKKGLDKVGETGTLVYDLTNPTRAEVRKEIGRISGEEPDVYDRQWPGTYVVLEDNGVKAAAFLREESKVVISLDYLVNNGSPKDLAGLMGTVVNRLTGHYDPETSVEMLLATEHGEKLYEGLFGEPEDTFNVASCHQAFSEMI